MHTCIEKVSCDTFFGIFKAIKTHQANTAMCDQHSCSAAAPHAAAKHQQLKASWGVAAETQANRKRGKDSQNKPEDVNTKYLKSSDESWTWRLHLPAAQNTQFFLEKNWASIAWNLVDISELQMACVPNQTVCLLLTEAKKWQANDLTLLKSPSCPQNTRSLLIRTAFNPDLKKHSFFNAFVFFF